MRKLLLCGVALAAITVAAEGPAIAAPPYNWTGCYIGGNVGGGWAHKDFSTELHGVFTGHGPQNASDVVGGLQGGCDYQSGMWVFGVRGMFDWTDMRGAGPFIIGKGYTTHIPWFATATGRVGFLTQPNLQIFVTGGGAWVRDHHVFFDPGPFDFASVTRSGALVGVGAEWMWSPFWSITIEYDYMSFGNKAVVFTNIFGNTGTEHIKQDVQAVLVSLNYRFGTWGGR